jgi:hypothetical protein
VARQLRHGDERDREPIPQLLAASTLGARADYSTCVKPAEHAVRGVGLQYRLKRFHSCGLDGLENR